MPLLRVSELLFHQQPTWHVKPNWQQTVLFVKRKEGEEVSAPSLLQEGLLSLLVGPERLCWTLVPNSGSAGSQRLTLEAPQSREPRPLSQGTPPKVYTREVPLTRNEEGLVMVQANGLQGAVLSSRPTVGVEQHLRKRG